jgi:hypothetical protein
MQSLTKPLQLYTNSKLSGRCSDYEWEAAVVALCDACST